MANDFCYSNLYKMHLGSCINPGRSITTYNMRGEGASNLPSRNLDFPSQSGPFAPKNVSIWKIESCIILVFSTCFGLNKKYGLF